MAVYITRMLDEELYKIFSELSHQFEFKTADGLVKYIHNHLTDFVDIAAGNLSKEHFSKIVDLISDTKWLEDKDKLLIELLINLGDYYYDIDNLNKSLFYYNKVLSSKENGKVFCNIGLILISIGNENEGLKLIERAYSITRNKQFYLVLIKVKYILKKLDDKKLLQETAENLLPVSDDDFSFLIWYYDLIGDMDNSITSYLQLTSVRLKFHYVEYYMKYMITSNQLVAMESYLISLIRFDHHRYIVKLSKTYIDLKMFDKALEIVQDTELDLEKWTDLYIYQSICYSKLGQIINSVRTINKVIKNNLSFNESQIYYNQLAKLTKYSKDLSRKHFYNKQLVDIWKDKYRHIYLTILENKNWKVKE